jgi:hypothetical protein
VITSEEMRESYEFAREADNMVALIKAGHCVKPQIRILKIGPSIFDGIEDE